MSDFLIDEELLAAIDMGSNSFHLAIARVDHGEVKKVASMSEKVQLAAGLDENKNLIVVNDDIFKAKILSDITFSSNDYILNSLLTLLPKKIYIHLVDNYKDEFINTLQLVFENKVNLCTECNICQLYKKTKIPHSEHS